MSPRGKYNPVPDNVRELLIERLNKGEPMSVLSEFFNIKLNTIWSIYQNYIKTGSKAKKSKEHRPPILTPLMKESICNWLDKDAHLTLKDIQDKLHDQYRITVSTTTIRRYTKNSNSILGVAGQSKMSTLGLEDAKKIVAFHAVDELLQDKTIIGIGSGSTVVYAVQRIAEKVSQLKYNIRCIPSSFQARQLIIEHRLPLSDLDINPQIDITIDGADEVEVSTKNCIKGGGGCLLQEKIVASASKRLAIICDYNKVSSHLGQKWKKGVPIEVVPMACTVVKRKIESTLGGHAILRMAKAKAGPVVTDNSNFILDWVFEAKEGRNWHEINRTITMIPGVVETGLFLDMATHVYYCDKDGSVHKL